MPNTQGISRVELFLPRVGSGQGVPTRHDLALTRDIEKPRDPTRPDPTRDLSWPDPTRPTRVSKPPHPVRGSVRVMTREQPC